MYLSIGMFLIVLGIAEKEALGALIGAYFAIIAIFNVGCAGTCCTNSRACKVQDN